MPRDNLPRGKREAAAERKLKALELRKARASYRAIGKALNVSGVQAYRYVQSALAEIAAKTSENAEQLRNLELESLDMAAVAIAKQVKNGEIAAIAEWRRLSESRRKLLGLDAPDKVAPTNPEGTEPYFGAGLTEQDIDRILAATRPVED